MKTILKNVELLEIDIEIGKRKLFFPSVTSFRGKKITGMEFCVNTLILPSGKRNGFGFLMPCSYLVLHCEGKEKIRRLPFEFAYFKGNMQFPIININHVIETEKSYIEISEAVELDPNINYALGLLICFED